MSVLDVAEALARGLGVDVEPEVRDEYRAGDIRHCFADISLARAELGLRAAGLLRGRMRELAGWLADQEAGDRVDEATAALLRVGSPASGRPRVAIVVLTWNGRDDMLGCLASLRAVEHEPLDVIVVDNGALRRHRRGRAREVSRGRARPLGGEPRPRGGNDVGIRHALERGADHVLVLNNDVEAEPGFVGALVEETGRGRTRWLSARDPLLQPRDRIWVAGRASSAPGLRAPCSVPPNGRPG